MEYEKILKNKIIDNENKIKEIQWQIVRKRQYINEAKLRLYEFQMLESQINKLRKRIEDLKVFNRAYKISLKIYVDNKED
jgi:hypothetical protein